MMLEERIKKILIDNGYTFNQKNVDDLVKMCTDNYTDEQIFDVIVNYAMSLFFNHWKEWYSLLYFLFIILWDYMLQSKVERLWYMKMMRKIFKWGIAGILYRGARYIIRKFFRYF